MINIKFEYEGNKTEFDLNLADVSTTSADLNELTEDIGSLENKILSKAAYKADPSKELGPHMYNVMRGGERQFTSSEIEAKEFGFTLLSYEIDNTLRFILKS